MMLTLAKAAKAFKSYDVHSESHIEKNDNGNSDNGSRRRRKRLRSSSLL